MEVQKSGLLGIAFNMKVFLMIMYCNILILVANLIQKRNKKKDLIRNIYFIKIRYIPCIFLLLLSKFNMI